MRAAAMQITAEKILRLEPGATLAHVLAGPLNAAMPGGGITTPLRVQHFMAQIAWESAHFTRLEEGLYYTTTTRLCAVFPKLCPRAASLLRNPEKLAEAAYGGRLGNGPEGSGDGWRHRGRGPIQLTGADNYRKYGYAANPDYVATPEGGAQSSVLYWSRAGCNAFADADDHEGVTKAINGAAMDGLEGRRKLLNRAKGIFV